MLDEKYVVIKAGTDEEIHDAVVIRLQDVFAEAALNSYANAILTFVEISERVGGLTRQRKDALIEIADFVASKAQQANEMNRKLPD